MSINSIFDSTGATHQTNSYRIWDYGKPKTANKTVKKLGIWGNIKSLLKSNSKKTAIYTTNNNPLPPPSYKETTATHKPYYFSLTVTSWQNSTEALHSGNKYGFFL